MMTWMNLNCPRRIRGILPTSILSIVISVLVTLIVIWPAIIGAYDPIDKGLCTSHCMTILLVFFVLECLIFAIFDDILTSKVLSTCSVMKNMDVLYIILIY